MEYSAENTFGGRIKFQTTGRVRASDCRTILDDPGFQAMTGISSRSEDL